MADIVAYVRFSFTLPIFILYRMYFLAVRKLSSNSNVVATQTVCDFGFTPKV